MVIKPQVKEVKLVELSLEDLEVRMGAIVLIILQNHKQHSK